ncbi:MAG: GntR family transcriptional regulator, partial [Gammaproteobacteria bacterium]|nr:GntR family transcriptional regulator [Gammaproteobacteria bacterium]
MSDKRLYNTVARSLLELIDNGVYPAGSRLPAERNLAEQFKVSRVTIRQALVALQARGKVDIRTG